MTPAPRDASTDDVIIRSARALHADDIVNIRRGVQSIGLPIRGLLVFVTLFGRETTLPIFIHMLSHKNRLLVTDQSSLHSLPPQILEEDLILLRDLRIGPPNYDPEPSRGHREVRELRQLVGNHDCSDERTGCADAWRYVFEDIGIRASF